MLAKGANNAFDFEITDIRRPTNTILKYIRNLHENSFNKFKSKIFNIIFKYLN